MPTHGVTYNLPTYLPTVEVLRKWQPAVFWKWFVQNFTEPSSWYRARLAFARTTAVMSMVGHIIGYALSPANCSKQLPICFVLFGRLGDRHGENILFDRTNGDCCHVDFNCLFFKGLSFPIPERVPFRLTHNMVCF